MHHGCVHEQQKVTSVHRNVYECQVLIGFQFNYGSHNPQD